MHIFVKLIHGESLRFDCVKRFNHTGKAFPFSIQVSEFTQNILRSLLDLYGQYPISWLITPTETTEGAIRVFQQAQFKEGTLAPLIHTDRGAAYTSKLFNQYLAINGASDSYSAPGTPADNAVIEHWWADFKAIWIAHLPKAQTLIELEHQVNDGVKYFTDNFISKTRNDLTATEFRFGKAK